MVAMFDSVAQREIGSDAGEAAEAGFFYLQTSVCRYRDIETFLRLSVCILRVTNLAALRFSDIRKQGRQPIL